MNAVDVSKGLKRAATVHDIHGNLSTEDLNRYHKDFHTGILTPKLKRLLGKCLHVRKPSDYLTVYIVYRSMFSYMNWELYTSLLRELALNSALKMERDNLKRMMRTNLKRMTKRLSNKQGKAVHGGFIFADTAALIAGIVGEAGITATAVAATAATVGTTIASSTVATAVVGGVVTAAATATVEAIVEGRGLKPRRQKPHGQKPRRKKPHG